MSKIPNRNIFLIIIIILFTIGFFIFSNYSFDKKSYEMKDAMKKADPAIQCGINCQGQTDFDECIVECMCGETKIVLEGKLEIIQNKYPINVIVSAKRKYWIYETPKNFEENLNKTVQIEGILSPSYNENIECNICYRECQTCQCPLYEKLLYNVKILKVLN
jgi:hypothetical protein